jgi:hypothetical protein
MENISRCQRRRDCDVVCKRETVVVLRDRGQDIKDFVGECRNQ